MIDRTASVFVAGHRGLVGTAVCRVLADRGFTRLLRRTRVELDLLDTTAVESFFSESQPRYVILAAAKVGGILANDTYPADFLGDNLRIQSNVIEAAVRHGTEKLCFLGSSCIYPRLAPQPIQESSLLTGPLEKTNGWYAVAKIAGIKLCQAHALQHGFNAISIMPSNIYGPGDNFDLQTSHVLAALIRKFHEGKIADASEVIVWGSGRPRREFLHVDDLADAICFLMDEYDSSEIINVGVGDDVSIAELAEMIRGIVGFEGTIVYDREKPDGTPRKLLDVSKTQELGWQPSISLREGIESTYAWFLANVATDQDG